MPEKADSNIQNSFTLLDDFIPNEEDLTDEAKKYFPYHTDILRVFDLHRKSGLTNKHMTPIGRHVFFSDLTQLYQTCKNALNYIAANDDILRSPRIVRPLIIIGLPRTGSTLLFNLLACDPNARAPLLTNILTHCIPPINHSDSVGCQERRLQLKSLSEQREKLLGRRNALTASHPTLAVDEDYLILRHVGLTLICTSHSFSHPCASETWFLDENSKAFVYDYHEIFMRMLNSIDPPSSHWILKGPIHSLFLDTFLQHYTQPSLIMTHRSLEAVLPSFCRLLWAALGVYFDEEDGGQARRAINGVGLRLIDAMVEHLINFRSRSSSTAGKGIFDVGYDDLIARPIETVRKIYEHFSLPYSDEFEARMRQWLIDNPQGKQGRNSYQVSDLALTDEEIRKRYRDYINLFAQHLPSASVD